MPNEARGLVAVLAIALLTAAAYQLSVALALATLGGLLLALAVVDGLVGGRRNGRTG